MGDHCISIVPRQLHYPGAAKKAKEILDWLVAEQIVQSEKTDCILGEEGGYALGPGAAKVTDHPDFLPNGLITNGLEIVVGKNVFHAGENGVDEMICPNCDEDVLEEDGLDAVDDWFKGATDKLICPACGESVEYFDFDPAWALSDLGFSFWNWPGFSENFIEEFSERLGCEVVVVMNLV
jgi:hypothetical protein